MIPNMNKKGISPLLATILLVSFAVSLGVFVISILPMIINGNNQELCLNARVELKEVNNIINLCYDKKDNSLKGIFVNSGTVDVIGFKLIIIGDKDSTSIEIEKNLKPQDLFDVRNTGIKLNKEIGNIIQVDIVPIVNENNNKVICSEKSKKMSYTDIPNC